MVRLSLPLLKKAIASNVFLDSIKIHAKGGHGGNGLPKYGGVGGQGGAVYLIAKENSSLKNILKKHSTAEIAAGNGEDASKHRILGRRGVDVQIEAPIGVRVITETGKILGELNEEGATCLAAYGGGGGSKGNNFLGQKGQLWNVTLDLKMIADVGLVGFPNAGKSTFLKAISQANPKIASYPFTTIRPNIGVIEYDDYRQITVADLPGLIEGAHRNIGMGHSFLKHVERTKLLLYIVDLFGFQLSPHHPRRDCLENVLSLMKELEMYDKELIMRPSVLLVNKIDQEGAEEKWNELKEALKNLENHRQKCRAEIQPTQLASFDSVIPLSAKEHLGLEHVRHELRKILDLEAEKALLSEANSSA